jgi:hypothetical protein
MGEADSSQDGRRQCGSSEERAESVVLTRRRPLGVLAERPSLVDGRGDRTQFDPIGAFFGFLDRPV